MKEINFSKRDRSIYRQFLREIDSPLKDLGNISQSSIDMSVDITNSMFEMQGYIDDENRLQGRFQKIKELDISPDQYDLEQYYLMIINNLKLPSEKLYPCLFFSEKMDLLTKSLEYENKILVLQNHEMRILYIIILNLFAEGILHKASVIDEKFNHISEYENKISCDEHILEQITKYITLYLTEIDSFTDFHSKLSFKYNLTTNMPPSNIDEAMREINYTKFFFYVNYIMGFKHIRHIIHYAEEHHKVCDKEEIIINDNVYHHFKYSKEQAEFVDRVAMFALKDCDETNSAEDDINGHNLTGFILNLKIESVFFFFEIHLFIEKVEKKLSQKGLKLRDIPNRETFIKDRYFNFTNIFNKEEVDNNFPMFRLFKNVCGEVLDFIDKKADLKKTK